MSDSLRPHESQHARPPCPSPARKVTLKQRPETEGTSHTVVGKGGGEGDIDMVGRWAGMQGKIFIGRMKSKYKSLRGYHFLAGFMNKRPD